MKEMVYGIVPMSIQDWKEGKTPHVQPGVDIKFEKLVTLDVSAIYNHYGYDGVLLTIDGVDAAKYELVMENMFLSPEEIAEKADLPLDAVMEIISNN